MLNIKTVYDSQTYETLLYINGVLIENRTGGTIFERLEEISESLAAAEIEYEFDEGEAVVL